MAEPVLAGWDGAEGGLLLRWLWCELRGDHIPKGQRAQALPEQLETEPIMPSSGCREKSPLKMRDSSVRAAHRESEIHNRAKPLRLGWAVSSVARCQDLLSLFASAP